MATTKPSFAASYLQPYHIVNALLILFVPIVRSTPLNEYVFNLPRGISPDEAQAFSFLGVVLAIKARRISSADAYLASAFTLSKVATAYVLYKMDMAYFIVYALACLVAFFLFPAPIVDGKHHVTPLTPQRLKNVLSHSRPDNKNAFVLVMFAAAWSGASNLMGRDFANLSSKFTQGPVRFVKIDIGSYPEVAEEHGISTSTMSQQVPSFILFRNGKEVRRRPRVINGNVYSCRFNQDMLEREFELASIDDGTYDHTEEFSQDGEKQEDAKTK